MNCLTLTSNLIATIVLQESEMSKSIQDFKIDRSRYDDANKESHSFISKPGLTKELVIEISKQKDEPEWMLKKRLQGYKLFKETSIPKWGPSLKKLDLTKIKYFIPLLLVVSLGMLIFLNIPKTEPEVSKSILPNPTTNTQSDISQETERYQEDEEATPVKLGYAKPIVWIGQAYSGGIGEPIQFDASGWQK